MFNVIFLQAQGGGGGFIAILLLIIIVFIVLFIRNKENKKQEKRVWRKRIEEANKEKEQEKIKENTPISCPHCKSPNTKKMQVCEWCGNEIY